jgi:hypothetical protein
MIQPVSLLRLQTTQNKTAFYPNPPYAPINYPQLFEDIKKRPEIKDIDLEAVKNKLEAYKKQIERTAPGFKYEKKIQYSLRDYEGRTIFYFIPLVRNKNGNGDYMRSDEVRFYFVDNPGKDFTLTRVKFSDIKNSNGDPSASWAQALTTLRQAPRWIEKEKSGS